MIAALTPTRRKLLGNAIWLYSLQGLNYLSFLAVLPYLVRVLGVERFGLIAFAQAFAQYFIVFTDYGFNLSATKKIALARYSPEQVSRLFSAVILIKAALMFAGAVVLTLLVTLVARFRQDAAAYLIAYLAVVGGVLFPVWLFQGMEKMRYNSIVSGGAKILAAILTFVFIHRPSDYLLALGLQSGGILVAGIVGFCSALISFNISLCRVGWRDIVEVLHDGWHLFVSTAATTLYSNTYVFLVGILAGNTQAGYFGAAEKLTRGLMSALGPITQAIYPHISVLADNSRDLAIRFLRQALLWVGGIFLVPSVLLLVFAPRIASFVFAANAQGSVSTLRWLAFLPFVLAVSTIFGIQTMIPFDLERELSRIYVVTGLASILCAIPAVRRFGSPGAGACLMSVEILVVGLMWTALERRGIHLLRFGRSLAS